MPAKARSQSPKTSPVTSALRKPKHGKGMLVTGKHGGDQGGRPTNDFLRRMAILADNPKLDRELRRATENSAHKNFAFAVQLVIERAHGKPSTAVEHTGAVEIRHVVEYTDEDPGE